MTLTSRRRGKGLPTLQAAWARAGEYITACVWGWFQGEDGECGGSCGSTSTGQNHQAGADAGVGCLHFRRSTHCAVRDSMSSDTARVSPPGGTAQRRRVGPEPLRMRLGTECLPLVSAGNHFSVVVPSLFLSWPEGLPSCTIARHLWASVGSPSFRNSVLR